MSDPAIRCRHASRYKAANPPNCGCLSCRVKWLTRQVDKLVAFMDNYQAEQRREREWDYLTGVDRETRRGREGGRVSEETLGHMMIRELQEEKATLRARVAELEAAREAMLAVCTDADPHDRTYPYVCLAESGNPIIEAATLADAIRQLARWGDAGYAKAAKAEAQLATARAEERERCRAAVEEIGIREAGHGHAVSVGSYARATDEDFEVAKRGCHYCVRVEVLHEAVQAIDALTPTPEPPRA